METDNSVLVLSLRFEIFIFCINLFLFSFIRNGFAFYYVLQAGMGFFIQRNYYKFLKCNVPENL